MKIQSIVVFSSIFLLSVWATPPAIRAQHAGNGGGTMSHPSTTMPVVKTGSMKSRVVEVGEASIVVEGKYQGKVQNITLMTDDRTKKEGKIEIGSLVTVKYREEMGGMLYAIQLKGAKDR